jgi:hypothetical protein
MFATEQTVDPAQSAVHVKNLIMLNNVLLGSRPADALHGAS